MMRCIALSGISLIVAIGGFATAGHAVPTNYGNFVGINVTYTQVTEDSVTDPGPLFGAPTVAGDTLDFNPVSFGSSSTGASGVDTTDGALTFGIEAKPNHVFNQVNFSEAGDFSLLGFGGTGTYASVRANFFIDILEVDDVLVNIPQIVTSMTFMPSGGDWDLLNDGPGPLVEGTWSGSISVDLTQALIDAGIPFVNGVTLASVTLDNKLLTLSEDGTSATIAKKDFKGLAVTAVVPEPSTALLLGLGLAVLARSRRSNA